ncbi:hypothetical protein [Cognatiyoonia sp. IB215182]|uniref:hypothetical protein n=1 Tax=Cognatiyoonia sp. IB215182 TaxID=3097353 RepID=UPI002A168594|nr:hypothetical protein [Cognatiyoonia sp. IB215182]MDX8355226.1 hypothetical protein [Cognatiyoonia sp. IB215182]
MRLFLIAGLAAVLVAGPMRACEGDLTTVSDVYPSGTELPENLLRFYIYFSAPMGPGDILPSIDLVDDEGHVIEAVFLPARFDLWSTDRTRLTLLLDPGRVKAGLHANLALGRALVPGETYHLQVSETARDARGCELAASHRVTFEATKADLSPPSPADWELIPPNVGTRAPLTVALDGSVDHLSLAYRLRVIGPDGAPVPGRIELDQGETGWLFTPRAPWRDTAYRLAIDPMLEDLAGNRPGVLFDQPIGTPETPWPRVLEWSPAPP